MVLPSRLTPAAPPLALPGRGTALRLPCRVIQSPLAGVSDRVFRSLVRRWAPEALLFTEEEPGPVGVQLFDHRPAALALLREGPQGSTGGRRGRSSSREK